MSTNYILISCIVAFLFVGTPTVIADEWQAIQEEDFTSASGEYIFRIVPDKAGKYRPGYCRGIQGPGVEQASNTV